MRTVRVEFTDTATVEFMGAEYVLSVESPEAPEPQVKPPSAPLKALVTEAMSEEAYTGSDVLARAVRALEDAQEIYVVSTTRGEDVYELGDGDIV